MIHWSHLVVVGLVFLPLGLLSVVAALRSSQCTGILETAPPRSRDREEAETVPVLDKRRCA
ncbi:MAG: hypothetical protein GX100_05120 [candidate division WS1 bacterium]|nr:hypothetical protein [candidate division WS1 bacterium]